MVTDAKIVEFVRRRGPLSTTAVAKLMHVSRQAAHRRLRALADAGKLVHEGGGRGARWVYPTSKKWVFRYRTRGLAEDRVWEDTEARIPLFRGLPPQTLIVARYAFTEMLNNAIEHSRSKTVELRFEAKTERICFEVVDGGIGAFENVRVAKGLETVLDAVGELSKGKVTTAPRDHTGEGIFFTSKAVTRFELEANGAAWIVDNAREDMTVKSSARRRGTRVRCEILRRLPRSLEQVFAEYTIDFEFARTRTVVRLFTRGTEFISRSEARRVMHGLDRFQEIVLDFDRVAFVGQGFADEVFRVWARAHPGIRLLPVNAAREVEFMIERALRQNG